MKTPSALVRVCNDFLASWTPERLAALPENGRPSHLEDAGEIQHWIGVLAEALCAAGPDEATDALRCMLGFLFGASDRAAEMEAAGTGPANDALAALLESVKPGA